jgi:7,8-dihydropterin-6-yl-methyl-4-(beta-D-ribofuranosyl)aminobenzene 5'-phosphate synthase
MDITEWFDPDVLIGGFHYSKFELDGNLAGYAKFLDSFKTKYYTCHCTGTEQYEFMKNYMSNLEYLSCGQSIEI